MSYLGRIENGVVVFAGPVPLPEGTNVEVIVHVAASPEGSARKKGSLLEHYRPVLGMIKDLPSDAASNVDKYLCDETGQ